MMLINPIVLFISLAITVALIGWATLAYQTIKGKNQIIADKITKIQTLEVTLEAWKKAAQDYKRELEEEQLRRSAVASLYDQKSEEYDELDKLHKLSVIGLMKQTNGRSRKFFSLAPERVAEHATVDL